MKFFVMEPDQRATDPIRVCVAPTDDQGSNYTEVARIQHVSEGEIGMTYDQAMGMALRGVSHAQADVDADKTPLSRPRGRRILGVFAAQNAYTMHAPQSREFGPIVVLHESKGVIAKFDHRDNASLDTTFDEARLHARCLVEALNNTGSLAALRTVMLGPDPARPSKNPPLAALRTMLAACQNRRNFDTGAIQDPKAWTDMCREVRDLIRNVEDALSSVSDPDRATG